MPQIKKSKEKIEALPKISYAEQMNLYELDETLLILHLDNAHTDEDSVICFVKQDVMNMGIPTWPIDTLISISLMEAVLMGF
ncbi:MAG: hypothetical protein CMC18_01850 [Flavobacteriaceae bacterium]|nr:hypothetical protein [Flavobacteriaceae bacterium]